MKQALSDNLSDINRINQLPSWSTLLAAEQTGLGSRVLRRLGELARRTTNSLTQQEICCPI